MVFRRVVISLSRAVENPNKKILKYVKLLFSLACFSSEAMS